MGDHDQSDMKSNHYKEIGDTLDVPAGEADITDAGQLEQQVERLATFFPTSTQDHEISRILIVDDEPYVLRALQRLLKQLDVMVTSASSGNEALEIVRREDFCVVVSDQFMPGLSGIEFLEQVQQIRPDMTRVMLTGNNDLMTAIEAINRGDVFRFVLKPWKNEDLLHVVEMAIEQNQMRRSHREYQSYLNEQNERLTALNQELERRVAHRTREVLESHDRIEGLYSELAGSFDATLQVLLSSMGLGDVHIADHCRRTADRIRQIALSLDLPEEVSKPIERAGMLHWIGLINAPPGMFAKHPNDFGIEEEAFWDFHPTLGQQVLQSVSALRDTAAIILYYKRRYDDHDFRSGAVLPNGDIVDDVLLIGCRILAICSAFEHFHTRVKHGRAKLTPATIMDRGITELKQGRGTQFDPMLTDHIIGMIQRHHQAERQEKRISTVLDLRIGMVLSRPVVTLHGVMLMPAEMEMTSEILSRIELFEHSGGLAPIYVWNGTV